MTSLLTKAFERASVLPESLQDEIARDVIQEIEWEQQWDVSLKKSTEVIDNLADQAIKEFKAGQTIEKGTCPPTSQKMLSIMEIQPLSSKFSFEKSWAKN